MSVLRIKTLILTIVCSYNILTGAHIVGGDVTYQCIETNELTRRTKFKITFTLFRDAIGNGAPFDNSARFGIYEYNQTNNTWQYRQMIISNPINIQKVPYEDECVVVPPNIVVEKANYIFDVELSWSAKVYQIAYQRCCRNNTISNIIDPGETGAAFYVEIFGNAMEECNNSPVFKKFPPILICNQKLLNFDNSASDGEGNRLEYEFCAPLQAGGTVGGGQTPGSPFSCFGVTPSPESCFPPFDEVVYSPNYSAFNPMGGSPQISIDSVTGIISGIPNLQGQYVVGVCVNEFKNDIQIGRIRREFQFNVVNCEGISETKNYQLCAGDSIDVNQTTYNQPGTYTQAFQNEKGCDSTVIINITGLQKSENQIFYKLCDDESIAINDNIYSTSGIYSQLFINQFGCDSTLTITIDKFDKTESNINIQLCDEERAIVNDIVYNLAGNFTQVLNNSNGCDSIIYISVQKGTSSLEEQTFSLCDRNPVVVNGQSYTQAGKYISMLTTMTGCDSILNLVILPCDQNVVYDLENCDALVPANSMVYNEFVPIYFNNLGCGKVTASNIYRDNPQENKHSCTQGFNNSIAMCVSASPLCNYDQTNVTPIVIKFTMYPDVGHKMQLNHLIFQQKAPVLYSWIAGPNGPNNYPTKYGIKIFKDNVEIFRKAEIETQNDWTEEKYNFFDDEIFSTSDSATYSIELTPYCQIGNGALVSVWDIDDVSLFFSCHDINNRIISGKVMNPHPELADAEIRRLYNNTQITTTTASDGSFLLPKNNVDRDYIFTAYQNQNTIYGMTTLDLVLTQRHILGLEPFINPLQYIAADVNNDQKVTAADIVQMRKIILGIDTHFKKNTSWLFLDETSMKTETNPWMIKRHIFVPAGNKDLDHLRFVALKVGDVDGVLQIVNQLKK